MINFSTNKWCNTCGLKVFIQYILRFHQRGHKSGLYFTLNNNSESSRQELARTIYRDVQFREGQAVVASIGELYLNHNKESKSDGCHSNIKERSSLQ